MDFARKALAKAKTLKEEGDKFYRLKAFQCAINRYDLSLIHI